MTADEIKQLAKHCASEHKKWHFHILTPECQLNTSGKYALVFENLTDKKSHVVYSTEPYMDVGKELVSLLHGADVVNDEAKQKSSAPSEQVSALLQRAKELMRKKIFWHHHMLFPGCTYNTHGNTWVIVFEDSETGERIESISAQEPTSDLRHIEGLFYSQKK